MSGRGVFQAEGIASTKGLGQEGARMCIRETWEATGQGYKQAGHVIDGWQTEPNSTLGGVLLLYNSRSKKGEEGISGDRTN